MSTVPAGSKTKPKGATKPKPKPAAHSGGTVKDQIYSFFKAKGLSDAQIYGIMGNARIESSLNPGAVNGKEGAIGIFQWEGGRRTNLQNYAAAHGGKESDLAMQLGFAWHELNGSESHAFSQLKSATTPADAAAVWDSAYERSSGSSHQDRISAAETYASGGGYSGPSGYTGSTATAGAVGGGTVPAKMSAAQYEAALGALSGVITKVPELKKILDQALKTGMPSADFTNAVMNSNWYKSHGDSYRTAFSLQYSNPGEYKSQVAAAQRTVSLQAQSMGVHLTSAELSHLANSSLWGGYDSATIQQNIAHLYAAGGGVGGAQSGQAATTVEGLKAMAQAYGLPVTNAWLNSFTTNILAGTETLDGAKDHLATQAASMYPSIAKQLAAGQTTTDVAQPYMAAMQQTLELPDASVKVTDPSIQKALSFYQPPAAGAKVKAGAAAAQQPSLMPLYTFQNTLRADPRWDATSNAKQTAYGMLHQLGQSFGFDS